MPYRLLQLAPGSYDIELDGVIMGSLVRQPPSRRRPQKWVAELLADSPQRPPPFAAPEHEFPTFGDALAWLGDAEVNRPLGVY